MSVLRAFEFFQSVSKRSQSSTAGMQQVLHLDRRAISQAIDDAGPLPSLAAIVIDHALTTLRLLVKGIRYRQWGQAACEAYRQMTPAQFAAINGRQAWANWRTIPRSLNGRLPIDRPLTVVDLCCGTGESTRVLAWWLPSGSRIIAYEQDPRFVEVAAKKFYFNRQGNLIPVTVHWASVLDGFVQKDGNFLADNSVDVVHVIGSLSCHFPLCDSRIIIQETERVLAPGGLAFMDAGRRGTSPRDLIDLATKAGFHVEGESRSWLGDCSVQMALRKPGSS